MGTQIPMTGSALSFKHHLTTADISLFFMASISEANWICPLGEVTSGQT